MVFKGVHWRELAGHWGIRQETKEITKGIYNPETVMKKIVVNGKKVIFEIDDEDELIAEKVKRYIWNHYDMGSDTLDNQIKQDMKDFLRALCKHKYHNTQMYEALLNVDEDHTFLTWFTHNLENMWT
mgnify:FL=1